MSQKGLRTTIIVVLAVVVVGMVVLRVFNIYPPTSRTEGTIGGVEKVERFRGEQFGFEDVKSDDPEVTAFLQSAEFQNLLKDDEFRSFLEDPDKLPFVVLAFEVNGLISQAVQDFHSFLDQGDNAAKFFGSKEYLEFYNSLDSNEVAGLIEPLAGDSKRYLPTAQALKFSFHNADFLKYVKNVDFGVIVHNQDLQGIFGPNFAAFIAGDLEAATLGMLDPQDLFGTVDLTLALKNEAFQDVIMNQALQSMTHNWSQKFQQVVLSQGFQDVLMSEQFLNQLHNIDTKVAGDR